MLPLPTDATTRELPFTVAAVTRCRTEISEALAALAVGRRAVEDVNLVVGELVMNAVRHGRPRPGGTVVAAWAHVDDVLRFSVRDGGHVTGLHAAIPAPTAIGGRGLGIVEAIATRWTYDTEDGTTVTADIPAPRERVERAAD